MNDMRVTKYILLKDSLVHFLVECHVQNLSRFYSCECIFI